MRKYRTACDGIIIIPRRTEEHLLAHPEIEMILPEAIGRITLPQTSVFFETEVEMNRVIGREGRVQTLPISINDPTLFAQRIARDRPSRVAPKGVIGKETTKVALLASPSRQERRVYILATAWTGGLARREPWDPQIRSHDEFQRCMQFWCTNALVWTPDVMGEPFESTWAEILTQ